MTYQNKLRQFSDLIAGIVSHAYHYERADKIFPCAVWQEENVDVTQMNNRPAEMEISGTLDYFTQVEFDPAIDAIFNGMTGAGINWSVQSVQFEEEAGRIHTEIGWRF